ncbi:hypothetical protein Acr_23g0012510 [Actinidia rufa]|uniref:Reverse transcriptase domain-containing protein n=1 Tax=Actinidia rufa TaxID=165716 RepID=A0A7J0GPX8_9ERIC|nr:hypothetical protein Acr_23g0012510 [Actinidia rufa]
MLKLPNGEVFEQPVFYENLPRFCPHCKVVGHTEEGCNAKKSKAKITEPAQARDSVNAGQKGTDSQVADSAVVRGKGTQPEWVTKSKIKTEDELIQNLGSSAQVEDKSSDQVQAGNIQQKVQLGSKVYSQQVKQIASEELNLKLQQSSKSQALGTAADLKSKPAQAGRKFGAVNPSGKIQEKAHTSSNSKSSPPPLAHVGKKEVKAEEKRKKDSKQAEKKGRAVNFAEFCADLGGWLLHSEPIMIASFWNIRGFNKPLKQNGVLDHTRKNKVVIMGILESKLKQQRMKDIVRKKFRSWRIADNFQNNPTGRILIIWKEDKGTSIMYSMMRKKPMVFPVTQYEVSDFMKCCYDIGISDLRSTGVFFTWSNNKVWSKLDRAMVNVKWGQEGLLAQVEGTAMFKLCRKLKVLKGPLKALNKMHFSHISARAAAAEEDLLQVQQQLHDNPTDSSLQIRVASLKKQSFRLAEADRSFCLQVAKAKYLKNCDKGTKFFHDLIKNNRAKSQIVALTKEDGTSTTSIQLVNSLFVQFYKNLLGVSSVCPRLDRDVLVEGKIVEEEHALSLIQPVLDKEIKSMVENIYMVQELLRKYCWNRISPRCIMKVDLRKAYDTVNWNFLEDVLSGLGFPALFIQWIMQCVSTTSYSISINGSLHGFFKGKQGLRQGDPISPFLFVLCLEYLSRNLGKLKSIPDFNFHPKCSALIFSHLAFADDLILFTRGDVTSVNLIMDCLKKFGECSGLCISNTKSNVFMAGISRDIMEEIKTITGFSSGRFPFRYLGIPVAASRLTIEQFNPLITKISDYVSAWAGATLSYAGRSELIRSVLQGYLFKKPLVAWREICRPKPEGGLGFIDLHASNLALLSKSLWKIQSKKDSLWVKWVHQVWAEIKSWLGFSRALTTLKAAAKWIIKEARGTGVHAVAKKVGFACTVYYIWATRNARMFEGKIVHPTGIIRDIKIQVYRVLHASFPNLREL